MSKIEGKEIKKQPLVSVCVLTYNSSSTILETLDSIAKQKYRNIELIVSDDCSLDNTIEICEKWINKNNNRFIRSEIIRSQINTGVSANANRSIYNSRGEWRKGIAGDDILLPDCISDFVNFVNSNPDAEVIFSDFVKFRSFPDEVEKNSCFTEEHRTFFCMDSENQLKGQLSQNLLPAMTAFVRTELLRKYPYNEKYRNLEDAPKWLDFLSRGYKFYMIDKVTVMYRVQNSLSHGSSDTYFTKSYYESIILFFWDTMLNYIKKYNLQDAYNIRRKEILKYELVEALLHNQRTFLHDIGYFFIRLFVKYCVRFKL